MMNDDGPATPRRQTLPGLAARWMFDEFDDLVPTTRTKIFGADPERWSLLVGPALNGVFISFGDAAPSGTIPGYLLPGNSQPYLFKYSDIGGLVQQSVWLTANGIPVDVFAQSIKWR